MFHKAYTRASLLVKKMQQDIDRKNAEIAKIHSRISEIQVTKEETSKFIENLEKFL